MSPNGKYVFKMFFNGCSRKVVVDDRLPASKTSRSLHVIDRNNPGLLWPALIEKAYLKIRGGYDFPGSNSGTDLWILTGWIPEQIFLQRYSILVSVVPNAFTFLKLIIDSSQFSDEILQEALWRRIFNAFKYGDVLITMGTGKLTQCEEEGMGLAGEHDYAVVDMEEHEGQQLFLVKNPWAEGTIWKGHVSQSNLTKPTARALENVNNSDSATSTDPKLRKLAPGTFWMTLSDVLQNFESIYLNWNPGLFTHREDVHFHWDLSSKITSNGSFDPNPQYEMRSGTGNTIWVVLSRHFSSSNSAAAGSRESGPPTKTLDHGFISLYAFETSGERVFSSDGAMISSPYVDSPNLLLKLALSAAKGLTIVVSEQALPRSRCTFTLSAFSLAPLTLCEAREKYNHRTRQSGAWKTSSAGGNASSLYYHTNPQFSISLVETSDVLLLLENSIERFPVHIKLIWARGRQIHSIRNQDIVGDSGEYRKGYAFTEIHNVAAGSYTIICSTFEQGQLGEFVLQIGTMSPCLIKQVPGDNAGRFIYKAQPALFNPDNDRVFASLGTRRLNRLSMSAWPCTDSLRSSKSVRSPLKLALEYGRGPSRQILVVSDNNQYLDCQSVTRTLDVDVQPGMCQEGGLWVVVERLGSSGLQWDGKVEVEVLSNEPVEMGAWMGGG